MVSKKLTFAALLLIAIVVIGAYIIYSFIGYNAANAVQTRALNPISTGSTDPGDVAIDLTPIKMDDKNPVFSIELNTHSVELSQFDLKKATTLEYNGKTANLTEAPKIEGHHSSGKIVFNIDGNLKDFTVTIRGIPKVEERIYEWKR